MKGEKYTLASAMASRQVHSYIARHLVTPDLTEQGRLVWKVIGDYYERDVTAQYVDPALLAVLIETEVSNPKHRETLRTVVDNLGQLDVSPENWAQHLVDMRREAVGSRLAASILSGDDTPALLDEYASLETATFDEEEEEDGLVVGPRLTDLFSANAEDDLIMLAPQSLNARLDGGMLRGHHVILFARPEMGKTTFMANLCSGFLRQNLRTLYLGNEEPIKDIIQRVLGRIADKTRHELWADPAGAEAVADEFGYKTNIAFKHMTPGTPREIEEYVIEYKPDVLIVDQLRNLNVKGSKSDGFVQHLEAAAKAVRQIGGRHNCLVISVTQAGDSATGKGILDMSDVADSKTGIPAQADLMIGLGGTYEDVDASRRVLSLPKNKRSGRHDYFAVQVNFGTGKITNLE